MIGEPGIIDKLKSKADRAALWAETMKRQYERTALAELRLSRSIMEADLESRPTTALYIVRSKAIMRLGGRRRAWHDARREALVASRRLAAWYQGVML
ncbi:MAG: hypothetical protein QME60_08425 [Verrucomicrobiota bacterium]|nr:hypothetical protein [Verrucomicrobiota bacterium]